MLSSITGTLSSFSSSSVSEISRRNISKWNTCDCAQVQVLVIRVASRSQVDRKSIARYIPVGIVSLRQTNSRKCANPAECIVFSDQLVDVGKADGKANKLKLEDRGGGIIAR